MLIKPFTGLVSDSGQALAVVSHSIDGSVWKVCQIGFMLSHAAPSPRVAAHMNGVPLVPPIAMQPSKFIDGEGEAPYAMEAFFAGPVPIDLLAGDCITCAVSGGTPGDTFTVTAYIGEPGHRPLADVQAASAC